VGQPEAYEERVRNARKTIEDESLTVPVLVDGMDNAVWCTYGPAPNSAYLIGTDGTVVARQGWYDPAEMERAIQTYLSEG
jgi:hypothetical protein